MGMWGTADVRNGTDINLEVQSIMKGHGWTPLGVELVEAQGNRGVNINEYRGVQKDIDVNKWWYEAE